MQEHEKLGTPRPSKARFLFISGFQDLSVGKFASARSKMDEALSEARKDPAHKEEVAICNIGVGFLHASAPGPQRDLGKAREMYVAALDALSEFLGADCPQIAPLTADVAIICHAQGNKGDAARFLARAREQLKRADAPSAGQTQEHYKRTVASVYAQVSGAHAQLGDLPNAIAVMQVAVSFMEKFNDPAHKSAVAVLAHLQQQLAKKQ